MELEQLSPPSLESTHMHPQNHSHMQEVAYPSDGGDQTPLHPCWQLEVVDHLEEVEEHRLEAEDRLEVEDRPEDRLEDPHGHLECHKAPDST